MHALLVVNDSAISCDLSVVEVDDVNCCRRELRRRDFVPAMKSAAVFQQQTPCSLRACCTPGSRLRSSQEI